MTKINKALDYNKLLEDQSKGKLLKKHLKFPLIAHIKYDGNYVVVEIGDDYRIHHTSGGLTYTHADNAGDIFDEAKPGFYLCERIHGEGKLGARNKCNLTGSKDNQKSKGHNYKVFDYLTITEYIFSKSNYGYFVRRGAVENSYLPASCIELGKAINSKEELDAYLREVVNDGYEGLMLYGYDYVWEDTKSRKPHFAKYKKRRTADLLCIGWKEGTGKYEGLIGSLLLQDSEGREVYVGSGMSDMDRQIVPEYFVGLVIEIEYEQIVDTYIQATHSPLNEGVLIRDKREID